MPSPSQKRSRRFPLFLIGISFLGFLLRMIVAGEVIATDSFATVPIQLTDMATYLALSSEILHGKFPDVFYFQPFYYSVFLPLFRLMIPDPAWAVAFGQSLCAAGIIALCGLSGARLAGRRAGLAAALFACFSTMLVFYVPYALIEIQQCFWITLTFYLTLRGFQTGAFRYWTGAGLVLGCSILSRGNSWCFVPAVLLAIGFREASPLRRSWKRGLSSALLFLLCTLAVQFPFILHNSLALGRLSGPSTAGPAVLALGNTPEAPAGFLTYPETYSYWMDHQQERSVPLRILDWAKSEPAAFLEHQAKKLLLFFDGAEIPNNIALGYNARRSVLFPWAAFLPTSVILTLAAASFFLLLGGKIWSRKGWFLLASFLILYAMATASFYILARFRVPALGLFCIQAVPVLLFLQARIRRHEFRPLFLRGGAALFSAFFLIFLAYPNYQSGYEPAVMRMVRPHGVRLNTPEFLRILDFSPKETGAWGEIELKNGMMFMKQFSMTPEEAGMSFQPDITLKLMFIRHGENSFSLTVNGVRKFVRHDAPVPGKRDTGDLYEETWTLPGSADLRFEIRIDGVARPGNTSVLVDQRRDYGRSLMDGKALPGELVSTLILKK